MTSKLISSVVEEKREIEFPCLMRSNMIGMSNMIALMFKDGYGIVVESTSSTWKIGECGDGWNMKSFIPLDSSEKIILTNGNVID